MVMEKVGKSAIIAPCICKVSRAVLITQLKPLDELVQHLLSEKIIAVDTESNSLYAYREQVCLVQFTTSFSTT
jgi:hypothetical protein